MIKKLMKAMLSLLMVSALLPVSSYQMQAKESVDELIINDSETGNGLHQFEFAGNWGTSEGYPDRFHDGDEHWYNFARYTQGDPLPSYTIRFKGTGIELYGETQPGLGIYTIYLDGEKIDTADAYSAERVSKTKLYGITDIPYGEHTLKVELSKTKNSSSTGTDGEIDFAKVLGTQEEISDVYVSKIEDSDTTSTNELFKFKYTGGWTAGSGHPDMFSNGDEHYAHAQDFYEISFIGTKIEIYATRDAGHGIYDVFMDGKPAGTADGTITGSRIHQQMIYASEELPQGEHTIKVMLPEGATGAIQVDFAKVYHGAIDPSTITLSDQEVHLESGMSKQITASVSPSVATNKNIVWTSADDSIATVDENGVILAVAEDNASTTITATVKGTEITADVNVTVVPAVEYLSAYVGSTDIQDTQEDYDSLLGNYQGSWSDIAWKGDVLNSKIVTCSRNKDVHNAEVIASDFTNGNAVIDASNVEIKWLKDVLANIGRGNGGAPVKPFPDVIHKGGKIDIAPETVQSAWITIQIPNDAQPGIYTGTIKVTADELDTPYEFEYEFEVLDLEQPDTTETDTQLQIWQHPFSVANYYGVAEEDYFTEEHFKYMRASMEEYKSIGGRDVVANIVEEAWGHQSYYGDPSMVKWTKKADGTFTFDYTWYDAWINFQIESGVLDPENGIGQIKCYSIVPWNNQIAYFDEAQNKVVKKTYAPGNDDWKAMWTPFLTDFMDHSKEKGWFDMTYISMDERGLNQLRPAVELIESIKDSEGNSFKISSAFNYSDQSDYSFTDKIDDISIGVGHVSHTSDKMRDMSDHRRELGLITTIYACTGDYPGNFTISDPVDNMWMMWYSMTHNTDGFMRWAWDNWVPDPLTNVTYKYWEPGDGWFIYPTEKGDDSNPDYFYSTPRYEMMKKGIRDINKAKYLMSLSDELNIEVTELVQSMGRGNQGGNGYGSAVAATEADRQVTISEANRMRNTILDISKNYANENKEDTTLMKQILASVITKAQSLMNSEQFTTLPLNVQAMINVRLNEAETIYANTAATNKQCLEAWKNLSDALQYADFKADKTMLKDLIAICEAIDLSKYEEGIEAFEAALQKAQEVVADDNVLQNTIDAAYDTLLTAQNGLKEKPVIVVDKKLLSYAIDLAKERIAEKELYVQNDAWKAFETALAEAETVMNDEEADQVMVDNAVSKLLHAYEDIRLVPSEEKLSQLKDFIDSTAQINRSLFSSEELDMIDGAVLKAQLMLESKDFNDEEFAAFASTMGTITELINHKQVDTPIDNEKPNDHTNNGIDPNVSNKGNTPNTFDATNIAGLTGMFAIAGAAVLVLMYRRRRHS